MWLFSHTPDVDLFLTLVQLLCYHEWTLHVSLFELCLSIRHEEFRPRPTIITCEMLVAKNLRKRVNFCHSCMIFMVRETFPARPSIGGMFLGGITSRGYTQKNLNGGGLYHYCNKAGVCYNTTNLHKFDNTIWQLCYIIYV